MDSVDPGALLAGMSGPSTPGGASASGNVDAQILALLKQHGPAQSVQPSEAAQNAQAAASVTPQGSNGVTTWLRNAPAAAGGEMYRLYKGIRGQKLDHGRRCGLHCTAGHGCTRGVNRCCSALRTASPRTTGGESGGHEYGPRRPTGGRYRRSRATPRWGRYGSRYGRPATWRGSGPRQDR